MESRREGERQTLEVLPAAATPPQYSVNDYEMNTLCISLAPGNFCHRSGVSQALLCTSRVCSVQHPHACPWPHSECWEPYEMGGRKSPEA